MQSYADLKKVYDYSRIKRQTDGDSRTVCKMIELMLESLRERESLEARWRSDLMLEIKECERLRGALQRLTRLVVQQELDIARLRQTLFDRQGESRRAVLDNSPEAEEER